jgi:hypothetical protein
MSPEVSSTLIEVTKTATLMLYVVFLKRRKLYRAMFPAKIEK